jgi:multidrug resistance efflux pump
LALPQRVEAAQARETRRQQIIGIVRETEHHVSPQTAGRLAAVYVVKGQTVHQGDLLAKLEAPELAAAVGRAKADSGETKAKRDNTYAGPRQEEIARAEQDVQVADSNLMLARQQFARFSDLSSKGYASRQVFDEVSAGVRKAETNLDATKAILAQLLAGPTPQERAVADANVALARATTATVEAKLAKTKLFAPVDGTVAVVVGTPGEIVGAGEPVLTIASTQGDWFSFTVREDQLGDIAIGKTLEVVSDLASVDGRVTELRPLGEFATWRAARAVGDHDLNSFVVRVDPLTPNLGLLPGMTVRVTRPSMSAQMQ